MAAEATHLVLAEKVFEKYFPGKDKREFFVGTVFPDIRYLGVIAREKTHFECLTLGDIQKEESSFLAGFKFHSLVDEVGAQFFYDHGAYDLLPESPYTGQTLKLLADGVLYSKVSNWNTLIAYFGDVLPEELGFGISKDVIGKWHSALRHYLGVRLSDESIWVFVRDIQKPKEMAEEIIKIKHEIEGNQGIIALIEQFYEEFETLVIP